MEVIISNNFSGLLRSSVHLLNFDLQFLPCYSNGIHQILREYYLQVTVQYFLDPFWIRTLESLKQLLCHSNL